MLLKKIILVLVFQLLFFLHLKSQPLKGRLNIITNIGRGFIIRHSARMGNIANTHFNIYEASLSYLTDGSKEWHSVYSYPEYGIDLGYIPFQNPILGNGAYAIPFMEKKLFGFSKIKFCYKIGYGLSYTSNPYNPESNFKNIAISSAIGYALRGEFSVNFKIYEGLRARAVLMMTHFSNASFKIPNSGLNIPALGFGLSYTPFIKNFVLKADTFLHTYNKKITFNIIGAATVREIGLPGGKKYWGLNLLTYVNKRINRKSALNLGLDLFVNSAQKKIIESDTNIIGKKPDFKQAAITMGHELFINKLSLLTQVGYYFYSPYPNHLPVYQRYSLKYWLSQHFFSAISLKCHAGTAEYVEMSAGIKL